MCVLMGLKQCQHNIKKKNPLSIERENTGKNILNFLSKKYVLLK